MSKNLSNKSFLVTGAGRGQGAAHAKHLAELGASVVLLDGPGPVDSARYPMATAAEVDAVAGAIRASGGSAHAVHGDVRHQADLDRAVAECIEQFGGIDGAVANAGIWGELALSWETSEEAWSETLDINLTGAWRTVKAVAPHLVEKRAGSIVLVSSVVGLSEGMTFGSPYTAAKQGVIGLMTTAAQELGQYNVRVNAICPGFVDTDMHRWQEAMDLMAGHEGGTQADLEQAGRAYGILARGGLEADEVSPVVAFLLGDSGAAMTGTAIPVDAGHTILSRVNQSA